MRNIVRPSDYTQRTVSNFLGRIRTCRYIVLKNIRKYALKNVFKNNVSVGEDIEDSANTASSNLIEILNIDTDSSDILLSVRKY
ncbi:hypothetical protein WN48_08005 [Eufriesea mexicana]|nr:hypothetical protein WN48_08005 [Eufriesea mexicana]